ncbi:MAG: flagellar FliJ family protein [Candidatus Hydrogenedentes bacterium]|nr:flagellar FliJ family protein [Candidatus Hydrogenedentota bacterium]
MARRRPFRYHALLRVRKRQEELKAAALARIRRGIRRNEEERDHIAAAQRSMFDEAGRRSETSFRARDVQRYFDYERHLARLAVEKDAALAELRKREEASRAELEEATKKKRVVELLKERQDGAFMADVMKEEQKFTDEIATIHAAISLTHGRES